MTETNLQLGQKVDAASSPDKAIIQSVSVPYDHRAPVFCARFTCPEMTSLCPVTGQPDFATLIIDYIPLENLIESKSLKLFLQSFRNHGAFHEECTALIGQRLVDAVNPLWLRVAAFWYPRGGIPIDVFWQSDSPPVGVFIPELDLLPYRGR